MVSVRLHQRSFTSPSWEVVFLETRTGSVLKWIVTSSFSHQAKVSQPYQQPNLNSHLTVHTQGRQELITRRRHHPSPTSSLLLRVRSLVCSSAATLATQCAEILINNSPVKSKVCLQSHPNSRLALHPLISRQNRWIRLLLVRWYISIWSSHDKIYSHPLVSVAEKLANLPDSPMKTQVTIIKGLVTLDQTWQARIVWWLSTKTQLSIVFLTVTITPQPLPPLYILHLKQLAAGRLQQGILGSSLPMESWLAIRLDIKPQELRHTKRKLWLSSRNLQSHPHLGTEWWLLHPRQATGRSMIRVRQQFHDRRSNWYHSWRAACISSDARLKPWSH